jgi:hypothetical protein
MYSSRPPTDPPGEGAYELFSRGMGFLRDGHPHQAAMLLGRAKLIEPDKASIREALGRALYMSGRTVPNRRAITRTSPWRSRANAPGSGRGRSGT